MLSPELWVIPEEISALSNFSVFDKIVLLESSFLLELLSQKLYEQMEILSNL